VSDVHAMLGVMMVVEGRPCPGAAAASRRSRVMVAVGSLVFGVLKFVVMPAYTGGSIRSSRSTRTSFRARSGAIRPSSRRS
jgi:hypothetical protein